MATKAALLPSDELHFLRWFWKRADEFIFNYGSEVNYVEALQSYEEETGRNAPGDYKAPYQ